MVYIGNALSVSTGMADDDAICLVKKRDSDSEKNRERKSYYSKQSLDILVL